MPGHAVGDLDYDHADAVLLAGAILLSLGMLLLGSTRRQKLFILTSLPINVIAIMVTHRRAGFAALAIGLVFLAIILLRANKQLFFKVVPVTALILSIYVGAEWNCNSGSSLCQPARAISSQFNPDPRDAASNGYRDTERFDVILNIQANPITGLGFGQKFVFYAPLPDLSFWEFWHYTPHNEILWVWMNMGVFGFLAFWWLIASALYRSGRLIQVLSAAGDNKARALLATAACLIVMQMSVSYVDLGLTDSRSMFMLWVMFGVIGHLPAILQRSTNTDLPAPSARRINVPEDVPLEVQVGVLARALIAPPESASPSRPGLSSPRQNTGRRGEPRWNQSNGATGRGRSPSLTGPSQTRSPQTLIRGRSAIETSPDSFTDELPWTRNPGNHRQQGRISDDNNET
ncbi:MAG TPA: O-antigen ligase family protein [Ktedonobacteraceae bacterium]|nr:O-antigen ligase family protein [Ktedonobacteraceae bacterium]